MIGKRVLVVDDEVEVGNVVKTLLSRVGFSVDFVESGKNALERLRNGNYTFLITDINMPEMNGFDLINTVVKDNPEISIIAMTGFDKDYTYMEVVDAGANDFIIKPFKKILASIC